VVVLHIKITIHRSLTRPPTCAPTYQSPSKFKTFGKLVVK